MHEQAREERCRNLPAHGPLCSLSHFLGIDDFFRRPSAALRYAPPLLPSCSLPESKDTQCFFPEIVFKSPFWILFGAVRRPRKRHLFYRLLASSPLNFRPIPPDLDL